MQNIQKIQPTLSLERADITLKGWDIDINATGPDHRDFHPKAKRFLSPDSYLIENVEELQKRPSESNLYSYAASDPINRFDPTGEAAPLEQDSKITSEYGPREIKEGAGDFHKGVDLRAPEGSKVKAVEAGTVADAGSPKKGDAGGSRVIIKHKDGSYTVSRHVDPSVKKGAKVQEGQKIGKTCVGDSCGTKQPHLHFERVKSGESKLSNPTEFLKQEFKKEGLKFETK